MENLEYEVIRFIINRDNHPKFCDCGRPVTSALWISHPNNAVDRFTCCSTCISEGFSKTWAPKYWADRNRYNFNNKCSL